MAASGSCRSSATIGVSIEYAEDVEEPGEMFLIAELQE
jgi:hypothetical protein